MSEVAKSDEDGQTCLRVARDAGKGMIFGSGWSSKGKSDYEDAWSCWKVAKGALELVNVSVMALVRSVVFFLALPTLDLWLLARCRLSFPPETG